MSSVRIWPSRPLFFQLVADHCPHCNCRISAGWEQAAKVASRPVCQRAFVVPDATQDTAAVPLMPQAWMPLASPVPLPQTRRPSTVKRVHALAVVAMMFSLLAVANYWCPSLCRGMCRSPPRQRCRQQRSLLPRRFRRSSTARTAKPAATAKAPARSVVGAAFASAKE